MATKKSVTKKSPVQKKAVAKKSPVQKKAVAKKSPVKKKAVAKKSPVQKKAVAKKSPVKKKAVAKKSPVKKKAAAKKVSAKARFKAPWLKKQREALLAARGRYTQHAEFLEAEADQLARDREPGDVQFDEESGEGDSIAVERDRDLQLSAQAREAIQEIDGALERIKKDTYGICVASGLPIPKERLEAIPHADMRVEEKATGMSWR
jgi:RNA polymerase-binding transcription factor DksA